MTSKFSLSVMSELAKRHDFVNISNTYCSENFNLNDINTRCLPHTPFLILLLGQWCHPACKYCLHFFTLCQDGCFWLIAYIADIPGNFRNLPLRFFSKTRPFTYEASQKFPPYPTVPCAARMQKQSSWLKHMLFSILACSSCYKPEVCRNSSKRKHPSPVKCKIFLP